ncbi:MAG: Ig-like domain-containing protein [Verrucomicrobiota bacterium JB022]|nr:Ig-like domain-containing protein [Verrucomicrobiota bacterium JB022]
MLASTAAFQAVEAQRQMENLGRGVVAIRNTDNSVFVSWRLLGYEPQDLPFNLYRSANDGMAVKLNAEPLAAGTNFTDTTADLSVPNAYFVRPVINGTELQASAAYTLPANASDRPYFSVPLEPTPWATYVHTAWVGDLNGDGEYDYIVNRLPSVTGRPCLLDAYLSDGTFLWRVDFGPNSVDPDNIEPPASTISAGHNDGVTVYDLDGDGLSEVVIITANGVTYGDDSEFTYGDNMTQFVSVLDGMTGGPRATAPVPTDYIADGTVAGHFGIAYLDGEKPSFVFKAKNRIGSGAFNVMVTTWDFDGTDLTQRWKFAPGSEVDYPNFHQIRIADVDGDGRDEVCDGGYVLDDDGTVLYNLKDQGVVHGDRFHIGDLDPDRPGLEGFGIQQNNGSGLLYYVYDAATGEMIHQHFGGIEDTGRGTAADISAAHRGYEYWSFHGIHEIEDGSVISPNPRRPWPNFRIWWDGDVMSENLNREIVEKWDPTTGGTINLLSAGNDGAVDSWRDAAQFYGDIMGDWREEVLFENSDRTELMIYTTPIPTDVRLYTLPHNPTYRAGFTVKGYLQSHMIDYYLGDGMTLPPAPDIVPVLSSTATAPSITGFSDDAGHSAGDHLTNDNMPTLSGIAPPGSTVIVSRVGGSDDGTAVADASGAWTFPYETALADGSHYLLARLDNGQDDYSLPFVIEIETVVPDAPVIEVVAASEGGFTVIGTAEPLSRVEVEVSGLGLIGTASVDANGNWMLPYSGDPLTAGSHTVSAVAEDPAGNLSSAAQKTLDADVAVPSVGGVVTDTGVDDADGITTDGALVFSGTASAGATVSILQLGGGVIGTATANGSGEWEFDYSGTTLEPGSYTFVAISSDGLGSVLFPVTVDQMAPTVASVELISPESSTSSATAATFRVTFSEAVAGVDAADFALALGSSLTGTISTVEPAEGNAFDVTVEPLDGAGTLQLTVNAAGTGITDVAGNALNGGFAEGDVFTRVLLGSGTWTHSLTGGNWSDNANWEGGIVADGLDQTANFATVDVEETLEVVLDQPRRITHLNFGDADASSAGNWLISNGSGAGSELTLAGDLQGPSITVDGLAAESTATIAVPLAGTAGFAKRGAGTLVLASEGSLSGSINVDAGQLIVDTAASYRPGSIAVNGGGNTFRIAGGEIVSDGDADINGAGALIIDGGTASFGRIYGSNNSGNVAILNDGLLIASTVEFRRSTAGSVSYNDGLIIRGGEAQLGDIHLGTANSNAAMSVEGGTVSVTGPIMLGNQSTGGRGGHLRVTGGSFYATNLVDGLVIVRGNNNGSVAQFLGGTSVVDRIKLGFDETITLGTATLTLNGGTLYVGAGGIERRGTGDFVSNVSLVSGTLGAKSDWSTQVPLALSGEGDVTVHTANINGDARDITLAGDISGSGGIVKTGAGHLVLSGNSSFAGALAVQEGELVANGTIGGDAALTVAGGRLSGGGIVDRAVALQNGGTLAPGAATPGTGLTVSSLDWQAGGMLEFVLGGSTSTLSVTGALGKSGEGSHVIRISAGSGVEAGQVYTLAAFGSTDLTAADITVESLTPGLGGEVSISGGTLSVTLVAMATSYAQYAASIFPVGAENTGATDDYNGDGISNFLAFAFGIDPITGEGHGNLPQASGLGAYEDGAAVTLTYTRPQNVAVEYHYEISTDLTTWTALDADAAPGYEIISVEDNEDLTETVQAHIRHPDASKFFVRVVAEDPTL